MHHKLIKPSRQQYQYILPGKNRSVSIGVCSTIVFIVSDCHNVTHPTLLKNVKTPCFTYLPEKLRNPLLLELKVY